MTGDVSIPITALLVVDMQADFFASPELARRRDGLVGACNAAADRAHEAGSIVV